ncbi:ATP-binding protein [Aquimarina sp. ERC-38]|uniref:ATP-binding protein n=1 Tax=Aquimarina sp. ERC-38 TaxID=2949996 RepID=UPI0022463743|nr:ATP-binding protein [Aquimarina sp. ERC-38]UZO80177.1 ATP-binding protein [Aquimarina sp. ERC-38]
MSVRKVVITGGPSTGKTSIIEHLEADNSVCLHEVSRKITLEAQRKGVTQLFLKDPSLFSKKLLEGRIAQFKEAEACETSPVYIDRGIPDIIGYLDYAHQKIEEPFKQAAENYRYEQVFILPPWQKIHITDNERYENYEQASDIYQYVLGAYNLYGYHCIQVPFGTVEERCKFIKQYVGITV